jgi:hypothetical protein
VKTAETRSGGLSRTVLCCELNWSIYARSVLCPTDGTSSFARSTISFNDAASKDSFIELELHDLIAIFPMICLHPSPAFSSTP